MIGKTGRLLEVSSTYKITCYKRYPDMAPLDKAPRQQVFRWFYFVVAAVLFLCSMCMYKLNQAICSRCRHETFVARLDLSIIYKIGLYVNCYRRKRDIIHMLCMENSFKFQKCVSAMSFVHFVGSASDPMFLHPLDGISAT